MFNRKEVTRTKAKIQKVFIEEKVILYQTLFKRSVSLDMPY